MYLLTAKEVISTIWQCSPIDGGQIDSFEAVFDEDSLPPREKEIFESIVKSSFQRKGRGSSVRSISWKSRYKEPMLFVPDIAAGVFSRWSRRQDVSKVHDEILKGEAQGKVNAFRISLTSSSSTVSTEPCSNISEQRRPSRRDHTGAAGSSALRDPS